MEYVEGKVGIVFSPEKVRLVRIPSVAALQKTRRHNDVELVGSQVHVSQADVLGLMDSLFESLVALQVLNL